MSKRRDLLILLASATLAPRKSVAQPKPPVLVAFLSGTSRHGQIHVLVAFKEGLAALGWKVGVNLILEERWADGRYERLQSLAEELAAKQPAVMVAAPSQAVAAAAKAAPTTPIVVAGGDPLAAGLVTSLARPGGMITGVTNIIAQVSEKHVELLLDAVPKLRRIGFLSDSNSKSQQFDSARRAAAQRSIDMRFARAANAEGIESAIEHLAKEGVQALFVAGGPLFLSERERIARLAALQRWPFVGVPSEYAEAGALFAYGSNRAALFRRAAYYVDRILKGAKPGDLPIEQPTKFELVVNLKTAKVLGLTLPQPFLMRADRVIE